MTGIKERRVMSTKKGEQVFESLVELERKMWNRESYNEEDITLLSDAMDFIEYYKKEFEEFFEAKD